MLSGPAAEEAVLAARRLHRLDELKTAVRGVGQPGALGAQLAGTGGPHPDRDPQGDHVEQRHRHADERELRIVGPQQHRVEHDHHSVHGGGGQVAGEGLGDRVVGLEALDQIGRVALGVEGDRQSEQVPEEAGAAQGRGDDAPAQQVGLQQGGEGRGEYEGDGHRGEQHTQQGRLLPDEEHVDVRTAQGRHRRADRDEQEAADHGGGHGARSAPQAGRHAAQDPRPAAAPAESVTGLEGEDDTGEARVELVHGDEPAALAGVVDVDAPAPVPPGRALVDDVVVELPEQDGRAAHLGERGQVHLHALGLQPVPAGGLEEVAGAGAVPGDPAGDAQFFEGDEAAVVAEHHGQGGGAALHRLHLQHGGGAYGAGRTAPGRGRGRACGCAASAAPGLGAVAAASGGRELGLPLPRSGPWGGHGSIQSTGRWAARRTAPVTGVRESTAYGGPSAEDHR